MSQVWVDPTHVHFDRDRREAKRLGCPTSYAVPMGHIREARVVPARRGRVWLSLDVAGTAYPSLEEDPNAMMFAASGRVQTESLATLINQHVDGTAAPVTASPPLTERQNGMLRFAHRASGLALVLLGAVALVMLAALAVVLWAVVSIVT